MIEDPELRNLFQAEGEERLNHLQMGIQQLQSNPDQKSIIEDLFRDAHTLKGSARMLGISSIEQLAHALESLLSAVKQGETCLNTNTISLFYEAIDAIRLLVSEAVTDVKAQVSVASLLQRLNVEKNRKSVNSSGSLTENPTVSGKNIEKPPLTTNSNKESVASVDKNEPQMTVSEAQEELEKNRERITSQIAAQPVISSMVRIPTLLVNDLLTRAGDLTITKNQQQNLLEKLVDLYEYTKDALQKKDTVLNAEIQETFEKKISLLYEVTYANLQKLESVVNPLVSLIRQLGLVPLSKLFDLFPSMVRELAQTCGKEVDLVIKGAENSVDKNVLEEMKDPLMHLIRNSIDHGIETPDQREAFLKPRRGQITLSAKQLSNQVEIVIEDDGQGLDLEEIKQVALQRGIRTAKELEDMSEKDLQSLILKPGFSTKKSVTDLSGRGVGLDVVLNNIKRLRGLLQIESQKGKGCKFIIHMPISLLTTQALLVKAGDSLFALPTEAIKRCELVSEDNLHILNEQRIMYSEGNPLFVGFLWDLLELKPVQLDSHQQYPCIILDSGSRQCGVVVEGIVAEEELVIESSPSYLNDSDHISGFTLLRNGENIVVLNPNFILDSVRQKSFSRQVLNEPVNRGAQLGKKILLVDDSVSIRSNIKRVLHKEGYEIVEASDGMQAWVLLMVDKGIVAVVSDVEMPKMDGWELLTKIRQEKKLQKLPVVLLTSVSSVESKRKGQDLGASAYIIKSDQCHVLLLQTLKQMLIK